MFAFVGRICGSAAGCSFRLAASVALTVLGLFSCSAFAGDMAEEVLASLARRQDSVRSLHINWLEARAFAGDLITEFSDNALDSDVTFQRQISLMLEGRNVRVDYAGQTLLKGKAVEHVGFDVTNNRLRRAYLKTHSDQRGWGKEFPASVPEDLHSNDFLPLMLSFRPLDPFFSPRPLSSNAWQLVSLRETVNNEPCVVFRWNGAVAIRLALSIDKDYLPVQYGIGDRGNRGFQLDIAHEKHELYGWVPKSWRFVQMGGESGKITMAVAAEVRELVVNSPFDDSTFDPEFPDDTLLYDGQTKGNYLVRDGQRTPVEADLDGNILGSRTLRTRGRIGGAVLAGLLSVLVLGLLWRKSGRASRQQNVAPGADSEVSQGSE